MVKSVPTPQGWSTQLCCWGLSIAALALAPPRAAHQLCWDTMADSAIGGSAGHNVG